MKITITDHALTMEIDDEEWRELDEYRRENPEEFQSYDAEIAYLTPMMEKNDFTWIDPSLTGDLTSAPMFAEVDYDDNGKIVNVRRRWAFMDYQIISVLERLLDDRFAVWLGGN